MQVLIPPLTVIRLILIWVMLWWALVLWWPSETFSTSLSYRYFARIGTENEWGTACAFVALLGFAGLRWKRMRLISAHGLSIAHGCMAALCALGNGAGTGSGVYAGFAFLAGYLVIVDRHG